MPSNETTKEAAPTPGVACGLLQGKGSCGGSPAECAAWRLVGRGELVRFLEECESAIRQCNPAVKVPAWKRVIDLSFVLLSSPLWAPLMALIALYIKCASPGPVFFRQPRVGFRGLRFECLKFRTMKAGADAAAHQSHVKDLISADRPMVKMDALGDSRLIPGGKFLRSSGLDELPQLLNVLWGEMSIVGPRPCTPYEHEHYEIWHRKRAAVLPGLTGLWQVSGKNKTTFRQMILLDIYYAMHARPLLDIKIMLRTFGVLAMQVDESRTRGVAGPPAYRDQLKNKRVPAA